MMKDDKKTNLLLGIVIVLLVVLIAIIVFIWTRNSGYGGLGFMAGMMSMMGGNNAFSGSGMMFSTGSNINITEAVNSMETVSPYVTVEANNNALIFNSTNANITILAMGGPRAARLTGAQPPSYVQGGDQSNVFVIDGLVDPTLVIKDNTVLHITFVNLDSSDHHNAIITYGNPPYSYMPMQAMDGLVAMMPLLPPANYAYGTASSYNYITTLHDKGTAWYICTYPGHAQMGMYGKIIVD